MAGAAPAAAAAATASEHTRGTLVWVRPAAAAGKTTASADAEEWVKATVARVLAGGATLEVVLEGSSNEEESTTTISVPAADAPLQNPASRLGVEVRRAMESGERRQGEVAMKQGAPFSHSKGGRGLWLLLSSFRSYGRRETEQSSSLVD